MALNFFNSIGNAFDPNKNGVANAFNPNKNGVANGIAIRPTGIRAPIDGNTSRSMWKSIDDAKFNNGGHMYY